MKKIITITAIILTIGTAWMFISIVKGQAQVSNVSVTALAGR